MGCRLRMLCGSFAIVRPNVVTLNCQFFPQKDHRLQNYLDDLVLFDRCPEDSKKYNTNLPCFEAVQLFTLTFRKF